MQILKMPTFKFEEQRVIIRFLHLRGLTSIEIHRQLSETCGDGVMDLKNVRSWVRQFQEGRTSCENKPKEPRPRTSRSDKMIARVEQMVMEDCHLTVEEIASKLGISVGSVHTILHEDLNMHKVSYKWVPRMLANEHETARSLEMADQNVDLSGNSGRSSKAVENKDTVKRGKSAEDKKNTLSEVSPAKRGRGRPQGSVKKRRANAGKTTVDSGRGRESPNIKKEDGLGRAANESSTEGKVDEGDDESK